MGERLKDDFAPKGPSATILGVKPLFYAPLGYGTQPRGFQPWESPTKSDAPGRGAPARTS